MLSSKYQDMIKGAMKTISETDKEKQGNTLESIQNYKGFSIMIYRDKKHTLTDAGLVRKRTFTVGTCSCLWQEIFRSTNGFIFRRSRKRTGTAAGAGFLSGEDSGIPH